jgi:hypothetical protein
MRAVEERVTNLEEVLAESISHTDSVISELSMEMRESKSHTDSVISELSMEMRKSKSHIDSVISELSMEMRKSKSHIDLVISELSMEMRESKSHTDSVISELSMEMRESKSHTDLVISELSIKMRESKSHTDSVISELSMEMREFKNEMQIFKKESEENRRDMNRQWGALANKMGTIVEDIVAPATRLVIKKYFECEILTRNLRSFRRIKGGKEIEVDVVVECENKVFMIEVRSSPDSQYVNEIIKKASKFLEFFPEYSDKEVIPIFAGLTFDDNVIKYATKKGLYVMAYREWEYMDIINFDKVKRNN